MYAVRVWSFEGLVTVNRKSQFCFSGVNILCVITSCFTLALEHLSARIQNLLVQNPENGYLGGDSRIIHLPLLEPPLSRSSLEVV